MRFPSALTIQTVSIQKVRSLLGWPFVAVLCSLTWSERSDAQVHYHEDGNPWKQRAHSGPDAEAPGWFYNLGVTGMRVRLLKDAPNVLLVEHVMAGSPGEGIVEPGDRILGVMGKRFTTPHKNGYGMDRFGPEGPILSFAIALDLALTGIPNPLGPNAGSPTGANPGSPLPLPLRIQRGDESLITSMPLPTGSATYGLDFPEGDAKLRQTRADLLAYCLKHQKENGSWGSPPRDTFGPLALISSGTPEHMAAAKRNAKWHAQTTSAEDASPLINWRYMAAAIVLSEYYLATGETWVLPELKEIHAFLLSSQYTDMAQVNPKVKESHPHSWPQTPQEAIGGFGHNPEFEGYGPIAMITAQGAIAFSLMHAAGVEVDAERHRAMYAFLARATGKNGYTWYEDEVASDDDYADMGRTGASALAHHLAPFAELRPLATRQAKLIAQRPEPFPDTHGSPLMGMAYAALGANTTEGAFAALMQANRWWFVLAECPDGSFYYQPNRDNAGYGPDSRLAASAITAFLFSIPERNLHITGKKHPEPNEAPR